MRHSAFALAVLAASCTTPPADRAATTSTADTTEATRVTVVSGFDLPESARWDAAQDVIFVASITGSATGKDNNGFISRMRPDGTIDSLRFIQGGRGGVTLHAPKGMALIGDTLWVADIDMVRAFNARTGAAITAVDLRRHSAVFLNDVAAGPDGSIYVTDSGLRFDPDSVRHPGPDRVFRIDPSRTASVAIEGAMLDTPNGIAWDAAGNRFLIGGLRTGAPVLAWRPGSSTVDTVATGPGGYDGIEAVGDGTFLVTSHDASSVFLLRNDSLTLVADSLTQPADIGWDARRRHLLLPTLAENTVEIWKVP